MRWREVLWYVDVEVMRPREVALILGVSPSTVPVLERRARDGLREAWLHLATADAAARPPHCRGVCDQLGALTRDAVPPREKARLRFHLTGCARCAAAAADAEGLAGRLRLSLGTAVLGPWLAGQLFAAGALGPDEAPAARSVRDGRRLAAVVGDALLPGLRRLLARAAGGAPPLPDAPALDGVDPAAVALFGREFESGVFRLSFLREVRQRETLLGAFRNATPAEMWFDGGDHCDAVNASRSFRLRLTCNDESAFMSVREPATCVYEGVFASPIACNGTEATDIAEYKLKRLEKMAQEFRIDL
jgi:hypothetical protein